LRQTTLREGTVRHFESDLSTKMKHVRAKDQA
jgi:hypothetical protein